MQFTTVIEANIVNKNYTVNVHEWHDGSNEKGRTDVYLRSGMFGFFGGFDSSIYDYSIGRYYHITKAGTLCNWGDTKDIAERNFAADDSGRPHLTSSETWFGFGPETSRPVYVGEQTVRGIRCDKWTSNGKGAHPLFGLQTRPSNYTLAYYFSVPQWDMPEVNTTRVPVRVELRGTEFTNDQDSMSSSSEFHHVYEYTSFHIGQPDPGIFVRPCGAECRSMNRTRNTTDLAPIKCQGLCPKPWVATTVNATTTARGTLPRLPSQFTTVIEANILDRNYTVHMHEWHDSANDRGRIDVYHRGKVFGREGGDDKSIYDYAKDRYYRITRGGTVCHWGDTKQISGQSFVTANGRAHVTSSQLWLGVGVSAEYVGEVIVRGVRCDKWTTSGYKPRLMMTFTDSVYTLDMFFSVASWDMAGTNGSRIPVRLEMMGSRQVTTQANSSNISRPVTYSYHHIYDYMSFHVGAPDTTKFEPPCGLACQSTNKSWNSTTIPASDCLKECPVTATPTQTPTTGGETVRPTATAAPTAKATVAPTLGVCSSRTAHGCDRRIGGTCLLDSSTTLGWKCSCKTGFVCIRGCSSVDKYMNHTCMMTNSPTTSPTRLPTITPTLQVRQALYFVPGLPHVMLI